MMKFNDTVKSLLEAFDGIAPYLSPKFQNAVQNNSRKTITTTGDLNNTFPFSDKEIDGKLLPNKRDIKKLKKRAKNSPKEKPTKILLEIH